MTAYRESLSWRARAACRGVDPALFQGEGDDAYEAKRVCERCEVREPCLAFAVANPGLCGVWGGSSEQERVVLRRG